MFKIVNILFWLKKEFNARDIVLFIGLITLFFLTRIINLDKLPIFTDEGIYIHWAKVAWKDASWRFVSLTDGRQPLQTWGTIPFLKLFPNNALFAGRLFSVSTGFISLIGIFTLLKYLFNKKAAFIGSLLYIITPYFLFYDRMALVDSAVNAGFIWILFFSILLVKTRRLDVALIFGLITGMALLAKSSVRLFIGLSLFAPILVFQKNIKKFISNTINYALLFLIVIFFSIVLYNIQRLSPFFHFVSQKNLTFIMSFDEFIKTPFLVFFNNIKSIPLYVSWELGWFIVIFALLGMIMLYKKDIKLFLYLLLWILLPYIAIAFFSKVLFPRYLIFLGTLMLIFASYFFSLLKNKRIFLITLAFLITTNIYFSFPIIFNPVLMNLPPIDRGQYIEGRASGWAMKEIVAYAREQSKEKRVVILAEGDFGMTGDVLDVLLLPDDNIFIKGYWPLDKSKLDENKIELEKNIVLAVFNNNDEFPSDWPIKLIKKYNNPGNKSSTHLFELIP